jgi:hypothetical protein
MGSSGGVRASLLGEYKLNQPHIRFDLDGLVAVEFAKLGSITIVGHIQDTEIYIGTGMSILPHALTTRPKYHR